MDVLVDVLVDYVDDITDTVEEADYGLSQQDVVARVEAVVEAMVTQLVEGQVPVLQMVSRSVQNARFVDVSTQRRATQGPSSNSSQADGQVVGLGQQLTTRSLLANQGASALSYARVVLVLNAIHELLRGGRQATQRDLYYKLLQPPLFNNAREVNNAIQDAVTLLRVPRSSLGVLCSGRGAVAGRLQLRDGPTSPWQDCTITGPGGLALPGDMAAVERYGLQCAAHYLLLVEKDAVFQRLAEDKIWEHVPCVLVTAKGMPDLGTRAFAARLVERFPQLQPLGLVDYNPAGVVILRTYKYGNHRMGLEAHRYALPGLKWLGLRSGQLADVEERHLQELTQRDKAMLPKLREALEGRDPGWVSELDAMEACGYKGDIEAVYNTQGGYGGLKTLVIQSVMARDFV